ncbi:hypothetical protein CLOM_g12922 [Closterium sp. NIES-68]|nr:hypothetical protein CLOM_g12922 [Closterium sp. NIES-68]GJP61553.1 hypothetical protein CLOP_g18698 [Closterium sp. NIES-67]
METDAANDGDVLLEFRAGKMTVSGSTVKPDPRKGLFRLIRTEDLLLHLQWLDRTTQAVEEDMVVFPDEARFEKVSQSSGRVYVLSFNEDDRKLFFWMQEPKAHNDEHHCSEVNRILNEAWLLEEDDRVLDAAMMDSEADAFAEDEEGHLGEADMHDDGDSGQLIAPAAQPASQQPRPVGSSGAVPAGSQGASGAGELRGSAGGGGSAAAIAAGGAAAASGGLGVAGAGAAGAGGVGGPVQLAQLQNILAGLGQIQVPQHLKARSMKLTDILKPEVMMGTLGDATVQQRLAEFLPPELRKPEDMQQLVLSPQFQQQLEVFSEVLLAGKIDLSQFGIDVNKYGYGVVSFLEAIDDSTPASSADAAAGGSTSAAAAAAAASVSASAPAAAAAAPAAPAAPAPPADGGAIPQSATGTGTEQGEGTAEKKEGSDR